MNQKLWGQLKKHGIKSYENIGSYDNLYQLINENYIWMVQGKGE
jgi:hypothetical protein